MSWNAILNPIKLLFRLNEISSKLSGLETEVVKLRVEMGALAKRVDKLEDVTGDINRHINPPDKTEPLPKYLHAKNLLSDKDFVQTVSAVQAV